MKHMCPQNRDLVLQFHRSSVIKRSTDANDFVIIFNSSTVDFLEAENAALSQP
jgi:hypothetical protein